MQNFSEDVYTSCYCEENINLLVRSNQDKAKCMKVVFLSTFNERTSIFFQRAAKNGHVVWDYHVIGMSICSCNDKLQLDLEDSNQRIHALEDKNPVEVHNENLIGERDKYPVGNRYENPVISPDERNQCNCALDNCEMKKDAEESISSSRNITSICSAQNLVWDYDSQLEFPCLFDRWFEESILYPLQLLKRAVTKLQNTNFVNQLSSLKEIDNLNHVDKYIWILVSFMHNIRFRVIDANVYIDYFASDRSHMFQNGHWTAPPPKWPLLKGEKAVTSMNLMQFRNMEAQYEQFPSIVLTVKEMIQQYASKQLQTRYVPLVDLSLKYLLRTEFSEIIHSKKIPSQ